jgi:hypothetical protein
LHEVVPQKHFFPGEVRPGAGFSFWIKGLAAIFLAVWGFQAAGIAGKFRWKIARDMRTAAVSIR